MRGLVLQQAGGAGRTAITWCDLGPRPASLGFLSSSPGPGFRGARGLQPRESNLASSRGFQREAGDRAVIAKSPGPEASAAGSDYFQSWRGPESRGRHRLMPGVLFALGLSRGFGAPRSPNSAFWKTHSRAHPSWHSYDGSPFWKLVPTPSPLPNGPFSLCCRPSCCQRLGFFEGRQCFGALQRTEGCLLSKWC